MVFLLTTVIIFNLIAYYMPKRISAIEIVATTLFAMIFQLITDIYLDLRYDLYGYFEKGPDYESLLYVIGIYPAVNTIFLNLYPYHKKWQSELYFLFGCVLLAVVFENLYLWSGTFYYNGWNIYYSLCLYPLIFLVLVGFHQLVIYFLKKNSR
ncbi:CBO0543 family protein [Neobacillus sp. D3-1R]|uniref:CBO0543 family protein n=1 Tax=Neobacillus sp. D3-1R TaxID=3445778 RepID=UPI003FA00D22